MALGTLTLTVNPREHDVEIIVDCTGMTTVTVQRGNTPVRLMDHVPPTSPDLFYGVDPEVPNGTIGYSAEVSDGTTTKSALVFVEMDHGGDWLMPLGLERDGILVNVESLRQHQYAVDREVVTVLGRPDPVAVTFGRHWFSGSLVLLTLSDEERLQLEANLFQSRVFVFAPRENAGYEEVLYLSVGDVTAERTSALAFEDSRRWTLEVQSVASPPANYAVEPVGNSWQDIEDSGFTWAQRRISDTWRSLMGI